MAKFEVTVTRETVDELKFIVEAPSLAAFEQLTDDQVYEAADALLGGLDAWNMVENDIDVVLKSLETHKLPKLVMITDAEESEEHFKKYAPPKTDSRQMSIPGTEE